MKEHIQKLKQFLTEDKWIKRHMAVDSRGRPVIPLNNDAQKFCLLGAMDKLNLPITDQFHMNPYISEFSKDQYFSISEFNDSPKTTFKDITKFLDYLETKFKI